MGEHRREGSWLDRHDAAAMFAVLGLGGALLSLAAAWPTGPSRLIGGTIQTIGVPEIITFYASVHGRVRLADGREVDAALTDDTRCRIGDVVTLVEYPKPWGHQFRATIAGCRRP